MDVAALAGLCALLAHGAAPQAVPQGATCPAPITTPNRLEPAQPAGPRLTSMASAIGSADARDAIARVAYAEAGNQGDSGLAAVVYTILNRLEDGRWGDTVEAVLDAPHQFEPILRAGGSWRNLRPVSAAQRARIETIINLALDGRLPDLTNGARYFQNPKIVARRAANGQVSPTLVNFGGATPSAVIGAHSFYVELGRGGGRQSGARQPARHGRTVSDIVLSAAGGAIFVGENRAVMPPAVELVRAAGKGATVAGSPASQVEDAAGSTDPARAIFVHSDGRASARWR